MVPAPFVLSVAAAKSKHEHLIGSRWQYIGEKDIFLRKEGIC